MNKLLKLLETLGLHIPEDEAIRTEYPVYSFKKRKLSEQHLTYLKDLMDFHRDRQTSIESKTSQLVGQSSVVFTLFSLFVPLFYDRFAEFPLWEKLILVGVFLLAFLFYLFTIIHSTRTLAIHKYRYATGDTKTVTDHKGRRRDFIEEEIKDLVFAINQNSSLNDEKGNNLIFAHRTFRIANALFAGLVLLISFNLVFSRPESSDTKRQILLLEGIKSSNEQILREIQELSRDELSSRLMPASVDSCKSKEGDSTVRK